MKERPILFSAPMVEPCSRARRPRRGASPSLCATLTSATCTRPAPWYWSMSHSTSLTAAARTAGPGTGCGCARRTTLMADWPHTGLMAIGSPTTTARSLSSRGCAGCLPFICRALPAASRWRSPARAWSACRTSARRMPRREGAPGYEEGLDAPPPDGDHEWSYRASFQRLWEQINGPGAWAKNPWVWVVEFERAQAQQKGPAS